MNQLWDLNSIHSKCVLLIPYDLCSPSQAYQRLRTKGHPWSIITVCAKMLPNRISVHQLGDCFCSLAHKESLDSELAQTEAEGSVRE
jgi:hypothetical protein